MDRFVDWHVEVMAKEPFDILANTTWLPAGLAEQWETYWTPPRCRKVIDAALKYGVALEISSSYKLPKLPFLKLAKAAGAKFSFGSNGRYPNMGKLEYLPAHGQGTGPQALRHVRPRPRRPQSRPAPKMIETTDGAAGKTRFESSNCSSGKSPGSWSPSPARRPNRGCCPRPPRWSAESSPNSSRATTQ